MRGLVYKSTGSWYTVKEENSGVFYQCRIKGKMRLKGIKNTNPVAVGDYVAFQQEEGLQGVITAVEERQNYIIRKSVNLSKQTHIIAANIDLAFLVITLNNPPTSTTFIDRFLVTAEAYSIKTVLLFNKVDTYTPDELAEVKYLAQLYRKVGYECIGISATTGKNIEKEKENVAKLQRMENIKIPDDFNFSKVASLSSEALQKMNNIRPKNIAQASRISGVSPADINVLLIYLGK